MVRATGGPINTAVVIAAARGIILIMNKSFLVEYGDYVNLTKDWAKNLMKRVSERELQVKVKIQLRTLSNAKMTFWNK